jgi:capsid assembly protease
MREHKYRNVAKFAIETPWAILPETLQVIQDVLSARLSGDRWSDSEIEARIEAAGGRRTARVQRQAPGGVAVIPLSGVIVPRSNLMSDMSGGTSLQDFQAAMAAAVADPDVGAIVIDVDSPGGSTDLLTETATRIRGMRGTKPILAVADTLMASAAYWLASQADEISVTPSGFVGSIGVVAMHTDISGANEKLGIKPTLISAGTYKTEGNKNMPLSDEGLAHAQSIVDGMYAAFTLDVAKGRGVAVDQVRGGFGEGRVLAAKDAVKEGLADRVATLEETISHAAQLARSSSGAGTAAYSTGGIIPRATNTSSDEPASFADKIESALRAVDETVTDAETLRVLTAVKREQLGALRARLDALLTPPEPTSDTESAVDAMTEDDEFAFTTMRIPTHA